MDINSIYDHPFNPRSYMLRNHRRSSLRTPPPSGLGRIPQASVFFVFYHVLCSCLFSAWVDSISNILISVYSCFAGVLYENARSGNESFNHNVLNHQNGRERLRSAPQPDVEETNGSTDNGISPEHITFRQRRNLSEVCSMYCGRWDSHDTKIWC